MINEANSMFANSISNFKSNTKNNTTGQKFRFNEIKFNSLILFQDEFIKNYKPTFKGAPPKNPMHNLQKVINDAMDSKLILSLKSNIIEKMAKFLEQKNKPPFIIAVGGEPASGKTNFAQNVLAINSDLSNSNNITLINCDNYYEDLTRQLQTYGDYMGILKSGYDPHNPKTQDLSLLKKHLISLKKKEAILIPDYDFASCRSTPNSIKLNPNKIILYEGIFALNSEFKSVSDLKIYIESPANVIKQRYLQRAVSRGKDETTAKMLLDDLSQSTEKYISSTKKNADIVINGTSKNNCLAETMRQIYSLFPQ